MEPIVWSRIGFTDLTSSASTHSDTVGGGLKTKEMRKEYERTSNCCG